MQIFEIILTEIVENFEEAFWKRWSNFRCFVDIFEPIFKKLGKILIQDRGAFGKFLSRTRNRF